MRLYRHEIESIAYRALSCDARALLVEVRARFTGSSNRIFMSAREMASRMGAGPRRAARARDELVQKGFIKVLAPGAFSRKAGPRRATEYALLHEPLDGETVAAMTFMRWGAKKSTVLNLTTVGVHSEHGRPPGGDSKPIDCSQSEYGQSTFAPLDRVQNEHTDKLPRGAGVVPALLLAALGCETGSKTQRRLIFSATAWASALAEAEGSA